MELDLKNCLAGRHFQVSYKMQHRNVAFMQTIVKLRRRLKHDTLNSLSILSVNLVYLTLPTSKRQELQHIFT